MGFGILARLIIIEKTAPAKRRNKRATTGGGVKNSLKTKPAISAFNQAKKIKTSRILKQK